MKFYSLNKDFFNLLQFNPYKIFLSKINFFLSLIFLDDDVMHDITYRMTNSLIILSKMKKINNMKTILVNMRISIPLPHYVFFYFGYQFCLWLVCKRFSCMYVWYDFFLLSRWRNPNKKLSKKDSRLLTARKNLNTPSMWGIALDIVTNNKVFG